MKKSSFDGCGVALIGMLVALIPAGTCSADSGVEAFPAAEWFVETVVDHVNVGTHLDVAADPETGETIISYYDRVDRDLYLAMSFGPGPGNCGPSNEWHCHCVDSDGDVGQYNSLAVGGGGNWAEVWVSYYDATNAALKAVRASYYRPTEDQFSFTVRTIDSGNPGTNTFKGKHTAIALSPAYIPHIAYQMSNPFSHVDEAQLYARYVGSGGNCGEGADAGRWQCDLITNSEGAGEYAAIDYLLDPEVTIAYFDAGRGFPVVATYSGPGGHCGPSNTWICRDVRPQNAAHVIGKHLSLFVEENNVPHIAYYNESTEALEYATFVGSGGNCGLSSVPAFEWQCDWIDDMGPDLTPMGIGMEEDLSGYPIIAYKDATDEFDPSVLKVARPYAATDWNPNPNCGPIDLLYTWVCEPVDQGGGQHRWEADTVALTVNPRGEALVAYRELDDYPFPPEGSVKIASEPSPVFSNGFETGTTGCWSFTVP